MLVVWCYMLYVIYIYIHDIWYVLSCVFHVVYSTVICYMLSCICNTWNAICTMYPCGNTRLAQDVAYVKSQHRLARVCQKQTNAWPFKTLQFGVFGPWKQHDGANFGALIKISTIGHPSAAQPCRATATIFQGIYSQKQRTKFTAGARSMIQLRWPQVCHRANYSIPAHGLENPVLTTWP